MANFHKVNRKCCTGVNAGVNLMAVITDLALQYVALTCA